MGAANHFIFGYNKSRSGYSYVVIVNELCHNKSNKELVASGQGRRNLPEFLMLKSK